MLHDGTNSAQYARLPKVLLIQTNLSHTVEATVDDTADRCHLQIEVLTIIKKPTMTSDYIKAQGIL